jgi:uncharacterized RmlC-like cupin family protein/quinol monooxygenase YgiN
VIFITAKFRVKPGDADRWPEIVRDFTRATRSEPGCLWFDWARSIDDPSEYVLVEAFRDGEAAVAHVSSEHFRSAQQSLPAHLVETPRIINMTIPQDDWSRLGEMEVTGQEVDPATQSWHQPLVHIVGEELTADTAQSPGMLRLEAISGQRVGAEHIWMGRTHVAAGARSADHHHGVSETAIHVVSGHPAFVFYNDGEEVRIETEPGDFVWVPPFTPHREENPDPDHEAVVVIARSTQEAVVVNLPGPRS